MNEVLKEAGHGKFSQQDITQAEAEIYRTLSFSILQGTTLLDDVLITLRAAEGPVSFLQFVNPDLELVSTFVSKAYVHDVKLTALPMASQVYTVITVAVEFYRELLANE